MNSRDTPKEAPDALVASLPEGVIALMPMRNVVLFPHALVPIAVGRPKSIAAVEHAKSTGPAGHRDAARRAGR